MSENVGALSAKQEHAAELLADDDLSDIQIAAEVGVSDRTIDRWKKLPEFQARVAVHRERLAQRIMAYGIARREMRIRDLDDRHRRLKQVIAARAVSLAQEIPGGESGMLVKTVKVIGAGSAQQVIEEYPVDTGLLRELRAHEEQAAKEMGQWAEKTQAQVDGTLKIVVEYADDVDD